MASWKAASSPSRSTVTSATSTAAVAANSAGTSPAGHRTVTVPLAARDSPYRAAVSASTGRPEAAIGSRYSTTTTPFIPCAWCGLQ